VNCAPRTARTLIVYRSGSARRGAGRAEAGFELNNRRGSREIGVRDTSTGGGVFAGFDANRAAGRRAGQARAAKRSTGPPLIVKNPATNTLPLR